MAAKLNEDFLKLPSPELIEEKFQNQVTVQQFFQMEKLICLEIIRQRVSSTTLYDYFVQRVFLDRSLDFESRVLVLKSVELLVYDPYLSNLDFELLYEQVRLFTL